MKFKMQHAAIFSTLVIIFGAIVPLPNTPGGEEARTVAHAVSYIICNFLWARSLESKRRHIVLTIILVPLTEILQLPLPYRNPSIEDLIVNTAGTLTGFLISHIV